VVHWTTVYIFKREMEDGLKERLKFMEEGNSTFLVCRLADEIEGCCGGFGEMAV